MEPEGAITPIAPQDVAPALALVWRGFLTYEAPLCESAGIEEFKRFIKPESFSRLLADGRYRMWGCYLDGGLAGVLAVRGLKHISLLFVEEKHHRKGCARALFQHLLEERNAAGVHGTVTVHAAPYALEAYRKLGFNPVSAACAENGIRFVPMED
ncbi:MAG: GNAT family N-acetyltransferase, partial [Clostridiales bacterium]|nr:GNAT family N-acetyltransferase [Clostridiales bacterium]